MTAINTVLLPDRVILMADGAHTQNGAVGFFGPKILVHPSCSAALAIAGTSALQGMLYSQLMTRGFMSFEAMMAAIGKLVKEAHGVVAHAFKSAGKPLSDEELKSELVVKGWSQKRGRAEAY